MFCERQHPKIFYSYQFYTKITKTICTKLLHKRVLFDSHTIHVLKMGKWEKRAFGIATIWACLHMDFL